MRSLQQAADRGGLRCRLGGVIACARKPLKVGVARASTQDVALTAIAPAGLPVDFLHGGEPP